MGNRTYNILFHTHTVSGIVISVALYVIFFAGSFSFFRDEIVNWERGHTVEDYDELSVDFNSVLKDLKKDHDLYGRDVEMVHYFNERQIGVNISPSKDSLASEKAKTNSFFYLDTEDRSTQTYVESYSLGEFLYRLHFFAQVPYPYGYYLSGFVAFFFLFAILTGIIVHWKKIVSNFYLFRPMAKLKTLWTDAHTALGVIGFPFQFVYAVTGAFFMLKLLLVAPMVFGLYDGEEAELYKDLEYDHPSFAFQHTALPETPNINQFVATTKEKWQNFKVTEVHIFNYGDTGMHVSISGNLDRRAKMNGIGNIIYKVTENSPVEVKDPTEATSYLDGVKNMMFRLHFGDYAGYGLKLISFILGLISCFVIISGVMIWLVARDKKHIPEKRRKFNATVVRYYLAICLSMFPVTALAFILVKINPAASMRFIYYAYFLSWLAFSVFLVLRKNKRFINNFTLLSGSLLGFLVPITNGLLTGNWIWKSFSEDQTQIFLIDLLWLILSVISLLVYLKLRRGRTTKV
ncbi:MAG: PepSY-associated TM helix domain-containing protein [Christiangramia sp.]|nr:hypothetical protein [Christiangramia sp.]